MTDVFNSLEFGGVNSLDNGVFITGEAVYNSPERDVEMIDIPGRNGSLIIDNGRYKNVTVKYPAGAFGDSKAEFAQKLREFRNKMAPQTGYQRLVDTYNPDEYRLAVFKDAIEVEPVNGGKAGEFDLIFEAKPQRYLMSGEVPISIESGDKLFNPGPEPTGPLLAVEGYGTIEFSDYEIELENAMMGEVTLAASATSSTYIKSSSFSYTSYEDGDVITVSGARMYVVVANGSEDGYVTQINSISDSDSTLVTTSGSVLSYGCAAYTLVFENMTFTAGTDETKTNTVTAQVELSTGTTQTYSFEVSVAYSRSSSIDIILMTMPTSIAGELTSIRSITTGTIVVDSTVSILGDPTYIDCEAGECYKIVDETIVSLNAYIDLGSDLPALASGENTVTYDDTVTSIELTPRWWLL